MNPRVSKSFAPAREDGHPVCTTTSPCPEALGAASATPIPLAQLDFAGLLALALLGAPAARMVLIVAALAALAGLATAMPLWIPAGILIGAAALVLDRSGELHPTDRHR
jgi:hypothetical protein